MDEIDLFPRTPDGPNPFLLLDGHGSRFKLPFMEYINQPETLWFICIGVLYGKSYLQVGDLPEQNSCERKGQLCPPVSPDNSDDESDDEPIGFVEAPVLSAPRTTTLTHVSCDFEFTGERQHAQQYHQYTTHACTCK
jgi:hypothetical protein